MKTLIFLMVLGLFSVGDSLAAGNSKADKEDLKSRHLWTHEFPSRVIKTEILPNTYLTVTTLPKSKKDQTGQKLWLMNGQDGKIIWNGPLEDHHLVAGDPYPILVHEGKSTLTLEALDRAGQSQWKKGPEVTSLSMAVDQQNKVLLLLSGKKAWFKETTQQAVTLESIEMASGETQWAVPLGKFDLPEVVPSNSMKMTSDSVWVCVGGKAMRISRADQTVAFTSELKPLPDDTLSPILRWDVGSEGASLVRNNQILYLDKDTGLKWTTAAEKENITPDATAVDGDVLVATFLQLAKQRPRFFLLALDKNSGKELWRFEARDKTMAKWDRVNRLPPGLALGHGKVVFSMRNQIHWLNAKTGEPLQKVKIKGKEYTNMEKIEQIGDLVLVNGKFQVRVYDLKTGKQLWHNKDLATPEGREIASRRLGAAMMAGAFTFQNSIAEWQAQSMKQLANQKWGGRTRAHNRYTDYVLSPSARSQILSAAQAGERSAAWMKVAQSLTNIPHGQKFIERIQNEIQGDTFIRSKLKGKNSAFASLAVSNLALVNIKTGEYSLVPTPKVGIGCISAISADLKADRLYHGYHRGGLGCRKSTHRIDAYRLP